MRRISQLQHDQILGAVNEGFTSLPPAALEKDILLTEVLHLFKTCAQEFHENLTIVFGGGTSLIKALPILRRMSEDLDFKIVPMGSISLNRTYLSQLKNQIKNSLINENFEVTNESALNENRYFSFEIQYQSRFDPITSLRNYIKVEFTLSSLSLPLVENKIGTLLYQSTGIENPYEFTFPTVNPTQTAAEKLVGLSRKISDIKDGSDVRLIRHIYDLNKLSVYGLDFHGMKIAINQAILEDKLRFGARYPNELTREAAKFIEVAMKDLFDFPGARGIYSDFVVELISDDQVTFDEAFSSMWGLVEKIK